MSDATAQDSRTLWTIGHSNHALETFLDLLSSQQIGVVVDVRSQPYAKYVTHFSKDPLKPALEEVGIRYLFLGRELGGRPKGNECYDDEGYVLYDRVAQSALFEGGVQRLIKGVAEHRVAVMCSEEDPTGCHRRLLVGRVLSERGITLKHIRGDRRVQSDEELAAENEPAENQLLLFEDSEEKPWKSLQSVLPRSRPPSSSTS